MCFGLGFRLRPTFRGWAAGLCVCVCALRLYPANPCWGVRFACVCLGLGFGFASRILARVLGCVFLCVRSACTPPILARVYGAVVCSWAQVLDCAPPFLARVLGCVFCCVRSSCTPPILAQVSSESVCAWARVSAAPRHSWLGVWGVCVSVCALRLYPANPRWGVRCGFVCLGSGYGCAPPFHAGVLGSVCVCVRAPPGPRQFWLGCAVWVCVLGSGFGCAPPFLAEVLRCVCACVRAPLVPRQSWLGCGVWVCVLGLGLRLRPATPDWGVGVGVSVCTLCLYPAMLAWFCGAWGGVCLAPVPMLWFIPSCARCQGLRHPVAVVVWHLSVCLGCGWRRASLACLVAPRSCAAPRLVRLLSVLQSAFPTLWCRSSPRGLAPPDLLGGCGGQVEAGQEPGSLCLPVAAAEAAALGLLRVIPVGGPAMGLSLAGPSGVGLGLRALRWFACGDLV